MYKFRAWDIRNSEMISYAAILKSNKELLLTSLDLSNPFNYFDGLIWLPFSNIIDNAGNELYVGDVVSVYDDSNRFVIKFGKVVREVVSFDKTTTHFVEMNTFFFESCTDGKQYFSIINNLYGEHDLSGTRLLGNIYENPELIKNNVNI
jgi:hypothetical protein